MTDPKTMSRDHLVALLRDGEPASLLLTLCELTNDIALADRWAGHIVGANPWDHTFPDDALEEIRERLAEAIVSSDIHGTPELSLVDALLDRADAIRTVQVMYQDFNEQRAAKSPEK